MLSCCQQDVACDKQGKQVYAASHYTQYNYIHIHSKVAGSRQTTETYLQKQTHRGSTTSVAGKTRPDGWIHPSRACWTDATVTTISQSQRLSWRLFIVASNGVTVVQIRVCEQLQLVQCHSKLLFFCGVSMPESSSSHDQNPGLWYRVACHLMMFWVWWLSLGQFEVIKYMYMSWLRPVVSLHYDVTVMNYFYVLFIWWTSWARCRVLRHLASVARTCKIILAICSGRSTATQAPWMPAIFVILRRVHCGLVRVCVHEGGSWCADSHIIAVASYCKHGFHFVVCVQMLHFGTSHMVAQ